MSTYFLIVKLFRDFAIRKYVTRKNHWAAFRLPPNDFDKKIVKNEKKTGMITDGGLVVISWTPSDIIHYWKAW